MARLTRTTAVLATLLVVFAGIPSHDALAADEPPRLVLRVHDYVAVHAAVSAAASETIHRIYAAAGVHTVWVYRCLRPECHRAEHARSADTPADITVNIYTLEMTPVGTPKQWMGLAPKGTYFAWVFFEHVRDFASQHDLLQATVLGHVIAHEIGHLLLRDGHAATGIMRGKWWDRDLLEARRGRFGFTTAQATRIREHVARLNAYGGEKSKRRVPVPRLVLEDPGQPQLEAR